MYLYMIRVHIYVYATCIYIVYAIISAPKYVVCSCISEVGLRVLPDPDAGIAFEFSLAGETHELPRLSDEWREAKYDN